MIRLLWILVYTKVDLPYSSQLIRVNYVHLPYSVQLITANHVNLTYLARLIRANHVNLPYSAQLIRVNHVILPYSAQRVRVLWIFRAFDSMIICFCIGFLVYIKDDLPHWLESVTSHCHTRSNWLGPVTSSCHTTTQLIRANHFQQAIIRQISLVFQFYFIYMWFLLLHITFKKTYPMPSLTWHHISFFFARNDSGVFVLQLLLAYNGKTHFHFTQVTYMLPFLLFKFLLFCKF